MSTYTLPNDIQKGKDLRDKKLFIIDSVHDEIVFKASAIVLSDAISKGNIIANFDLIVLGDLQAKEITVKGKLICYGNIDAEKIIANEIIGTNVEATEIISREGIMAQELNADSIQSDGSILIRKDITVEELIKSDSAIICGDGFFSYGKVKAKTVMAVDNLEVQEDMFEFSQEPLVIEREENGQAPCDSNNNISATGGAGGFVDYSSWKNRIVKELEKLIKVKSLSEIEKYLYGHQGLDFVNGYIEALKVIKVNPIKQFTNASSNAKIVDIFQFLKLHKVLCEWQAVTEIESVFDMYCECLDELQKAVDKNKFDQIALCAITNYSEFIEAIDTIHKHGTKIADGNMLLIAIMDKVYQSTLGITAAFLNKKFTEKGWKLHEQ